MIENATAHPEIDEWRNERQREKNTLLWYREEYLVAMARRRNYWLLKNCLLYRATLRDRQTTK